MRTVALFLIYPLKIPSELGFISEVGGIKEIGPSQVIFQMEFLAISDFEHLGIDCHWDFLLDGLFKGSVTVYLLILPLNAMTAGNVLMARMVPFPYPIHSSDRDVLIGEACK